MPAALQRGIAAERGQRRPTKLPDFLMRLTARSYADDSTSLLLMSGKTPRCSSLPIQYVNCVHRTRKGIFHQSPSPWHR